jgi:hypothetical protein
MVRTIPFTSHAEFMGSAPYTAGPQRNFSSMWAPAVRPPRAPSLARPTPGPFGTTKTATSPVANPFNWVPNPGLTST